MSVTLSGFASFIVLHARTVMDLQAVQQSLVSAFRNTFAGISITISKTWWAKISPTTLWIMFLSITLNLVRFGCEIALKCHIRGFRTCFSAPVASLRCASQLAQFDLFENIFKKLATVLVTFSSCCSALLSSAVKPSWVHYNQCCGLLRIYLRQDFSVNFKFGLVASMFWIATPPLTSLTTANETYINFLSPCIVLTSF